MTVEESIFKATKVMLDVAPDDDSFDGKILTFINSALADLVDLGVGPEDGLTITSETNTWAELSDSASELDRIKVWLGLKVGLLFDPPQTGFLMDAHKALLDQATWRMVNKKDGERWLEQQVTTP